MLSKLDLILDYKVNINQSSNLQGVLMKWIDTEYAGYLHKQKFNPYSISISSENGKYVWSVCTLTVEAYQNIIVPLLDDNFNEFVINNGNHHVNIVEKRLQKTSIEEVLESIGSGDAYNKFRIYFKSPMAFKSDGRYISMPDLKLIFQNLINKYNYNTEGDVFDCTDIVNELVSKTTIEKYDIKSELFRLEKTAVPGCIGYMEIKSKCHIRELHLINLLLTFGEYSGVGIKSSIGMGKISVERL